MVAEIRVHSAKDLEQAVEVERAQVRFTLSMLLMRAWIRGYVILGNLLLGGIERLMFSRACRNSQAIIVYTVGTLGDNVLMLPAVAAIRQRYPDATMTVVTNCDGFGSYPASQVWGKSEYVDYFVALPNHPVQRQGFSLKINKAGLEQTECDLFVNLSPFGNRGWLGAVIREMLFARALGAKQAVGFRLNSYNRRGRFNRVQHFFVQNEARRAREVLEPLGITPIEELDLLHHDVGAKENAEKVLRESGIAVGHSPLVLLNPGSKLAASQWPAQRFGEFAAWVDETYGAQVVVNGTESEQAICEEVVRSSGGRAVSLAGKLSIQELIELLRLCSSCVSNNTGTMTLAAMVKTPLIVLSSTRFSPTFYMPISKRMVWLFSFSDTSYSYNDLGSTSEDMLNIEVKDLSEAYRNLMGRVENIYGS